MRFQGKSSNLTKTYVSFGNEFVTRRRKKKREIEIKKYQVTPVGRVVYEETKRWRGSSSRRGKKRKEKRKNKTKKKEQNG